MLATGFAQVLAEILEDQKVVGGRIRIIVTDEDNGSAELTFDGEWMWDEEIDMRKLADRLGLTVATLEEE